MTVTEMDTLLRKLAGIMPKMHARLVEAGRDGAEFAMFGGAMPRSPAAVAAALVGCELQYIVELHSATQAAKRASL